MQHRFLNESNGLMQSFRNHATVNTTNTRVETGIEQSIDDEHEKAKQL
ncbi:MAG: hypothetical protein ACK5M4_05155 [Pseudorhodobacter sp.]